MKPKAFGESSSEDEDECENCHGHVEMKKQKTVESSSLEQFPTTPPEHDDQVPQNT